MGRTSEGGVNKVKIRSGKFEGPGRGARRGKKRQWEMRRTKEVDEIKIRSEKFEGPSEKGRRGI
jgi:hypothetical protein